MRGAPPSITSSHHDESQCTASHRPLMCSPNCPTAKPCGKLIKPTVQKFGAGGARSCGPGRRYTHIYIIHASAVRSSHGILTSSGNPGVSTGTSGTSCPTSLPSPKLDLNLSFIDNVISDVTREFHGCLGVWGGCKPSHHALTYIHPPEAHYRIIILGRILGTRGEKASTRGTAPHWQKVDLPTQDR